jgi:hypothetical protein
MHPKKAIRKFLEALQNAPLGADFQVGITWDERRGWSPYQRIGEHMLILPVAAARGLVAGALKQDGQHAGNPEIAGVIGMFKTLGEICDECDVKNKSRVVPPGMVAFMEPRGTA